jgi:hypothetical protein
MDAVADGDSYDGFVRFLRSGWQGETHFVAVSCSPCDSARSEWCEFEERPRAGCQC